MNRNHILAAVIVWLALILPGSLSAQSDPYVQQITLGRGAVRSVAWSPDGQILAVGGVTGIWLYTPDLRDIGLLTGHTKAVYGVAFSPDSTTLASASHDMTVRLWDVAAQQEIARLEGHTGLVVSVAWSPDGRFVVSGSYDGTVRIWDAAHLDRVLDAGLGWINQVAVAPDNSTVISSGFDGKIRVWDWSGQVVDTLDGMPEAWHEQTGQDPDLFIGPRTLTYATAWNPDHSLYATADWNGAVWMHNEAADPVAAQLGHADTITAVGWSVDGIQVIGESVEQDPINGGVGPILRTWNASTGLFEGIATGQLEPVPSAATREAVMDADGVVHILDGGTEITALPGLANATAWSPDGTQLAVALRNGTITIWKAQ